MPLETPTPDGVLELFRDEIVIREAQIDEAYGEMKKGWPKSHRPKTSPSRRKTRKRAR